MKIGCCTNMLATTKDAIGIENIALLGQAGYDYVELPLAQMMSLPEKEFLMLRYQVDTSGLPCEVCNNFFPSWMRLTGHNVSKATISAYVKSALERAYQLGARIIVFGSSEAKNVPEGFPEEKAWTQLVSLLQYIDSEAEKFNIHIVIEPLNKRESNIINSVAEGLALVNEVNRKNIRLLVDYYHFTAEKEKIGDLANMDSVLEHVHFARPDGRTFPSNADPDNYFEFFKKLREINYHGGISVEAYSKELFKDTVDTLTLIRNLTRHQDYAISCL
jgi:D-psicose/D-tagatose/L-ribulose 3-epimerase